jgi:undecaprenyl-phosphate 4-deoxy-4-formamido-L-arabinose transferase
MAGQQSSAISNEHPQEFSGMQETTPWPAAVAVRVGAEGQASTVNPPPWRPDCTVVVPVYNGEPSLPALVERLAATLTGVASAYEVILVNDGSRDNSWGAIRALTCERNWVRGINLMRNFGQHNALLAGILAAQHEVIVTIDDDLQNPPEEIGRLLAKLAEGFDVVYGTPERERHGLVRDLASQLTKWALQGAMGAETARNISAFRAFRTQVREAFGHYQGPYVSIDTLLTWGTTRFAAIRVRHDRRAAGSSNYTLRMLVRHALNMMTGFSTLPLQAASLLGFVLTGFGMLVLVYVIGRYLVQGGSVPGFPFLASMIAIFSGAQMFALGIIGEYLARMHFRVMGRPPSVIRETVGFEGDRSRP